MPGELFSGRFDFPHVIIKIIRYVISLYHVEATIEKKDLPVDRKAQGLEKGKKTATFGETEVIAIMVATS